MNIHIQPARDEKFLWVMLYYAAQMDKDGATSPEAAKTNPSLAKYVAGWGRPTDLGVTGYHHHTPVGAVWSRLLIGDHKTYGDVDDKTLELAAAVLPAYRGKGIGGRLLSAHLEQASTIFPAVALNVRADNPAFRLYERVGFKVIGEITNRVGTKSYHMLLTF